MNKPFKLAIILPQYYLGGILRALQSIVKFLILGADSKKLTIYVFLEAKLFEQQALTLDIDTDQVKILRFEELIVTKQTVASILKTQQRYQEGMLIHDQYIIPGDPNIDASQMDAWLWLSDRLLFPIAPLTRIGIMPFDFIQRYVPDIMSDISWSYWLNVSLTNIQNADYVYCTTPSTQQDAISFAGVAESKVKLLPLEIKLPSFKFVYPQSKDYILWISNETPHKNQVFTFAALVSFYQRYPDAPPIKMIGSGVQNFSPSKQIDALSLLPHHIKSREIINKSGLLNKKIFIENYVSESTYAGYIYNAKCILHSVLNDNGTYTIVDGCYYGVPTLSSDYPAIRYFSEAFGIPLTYFDKNNPESLIEQLAYVVANAEALAAQLPSAEQLENISNKDIINQYWTVFKSTLLSDNTCEK